MPDNLCPGCGARLRKHGRICHVCKTLRDATGECIVCRNPMPPRAEKCTVCSSYQGRRRWFDFGAATLSTATAIITVIGMTIALVSTLAKSRSSTTAAISGSTKTAILVGFVNTGNAASVVRDMTIVVDGDVVIIDRIWLQPDDEARQLLRGPDFAVLHYIVGSVTRNPKTGTKPFWPSYGSTPILLRGTVIESDGTARQLRDDATLKTIRALIEEKCNDCKE